MNIGPLNLSDLKEKIVEKWSEIAQKIQESHLYNTLMEHYRNLSQKNQKRLIFGSIGFFCLIIFLLPFSRFLSSSSELEDYKVQNHILKDLIRFNLNKDQKSPLKELESFKKTKADIQRFLKRFKLLEAQIGPILSYEFQGEFGPSDLSSLGLSVSLKTLNLNQVVEIGQKINHRSPSLKLVSLEMNASQEKEFYFDVLFKLKQFGLNKRGDSKRGGSKRGDSKKGENKKNKKP